MICPHCNANNKDGNSFCTECGWKLIRPVEPAMEETPKAPDFGVYEAPPTYSYGDSGGKDEPVRKIGFGEAIVSFFKNYVKFDGRATRSEYWYVCLFTFLMSVAITAIGAAAGDSVERAINTVWELAILLPTLGLAWRRMHDIGKSGLMNLLLLIPLVGWIICIVMYCKDSDADNEYGPRKTERNR